MSGSMPYSARSMPRPADPDLAAVGDHDRVGMQVRVGEALRLGGGEEAGDLQRDAAPPPSGGSGSPPRAARSSPYGVAASHSVTMTSWPAVLVVGDVEHGDRTPVGDHRGLDRGGAQAVDARMVERHEPYADGPAQALVDAVPERGAPAVAHLVDEAEAAEQRRCRARAPPMRPVAVVSVTVDQGTGVTATIAASQDAVP